MSYTQVPVPYLGMKSEFFVFVVACSRSLSDDILKTGLVAEIRHVNQGLMKFFLSSKCQSILLNLLASLLVV